MALLFAILMKKGDKKTHQTAKERSIKSVLHPEKVCSRSPRNPTFSDPEIPSKSGLEKNLN
jgi:hypothetical protein